MNEEIEYWISVKDSYTNNLNNNVGHKTSIDALLIKIDAKLDSLINLQNSIK